MASYPKKVSGNDSGTALSQSPGSKLVKEQYRSFARGDVPDISKAPTSRVYTRDYTKVGRDPEDTDLVTEALGTMPFRI